MNEAQHVDVLSSADIERRRNEMYDAMTDLQDEVILLHSTLHYLEREYEALARKYNEARVLINGASHQLAAFCLVNGEVKSSLKE